MSQAHDPAANDLIEQWRARRREIIKMLPLKLRSEYRRLGLLIKGALSEKREARLRDIRSKAEQRATVSEREKKRIAEETNSEIRTITEQIAEESEREAANLAEMLDRRRESLTELEREILRIQEEKRTPLHRHRENLIAFLAAHGPATRKEIVEATGIPPGSLSLLLRDEQIEQVRHGTWRLFRRKGK
jgi:hypothetical protein